MNIATPHPLAVAEEGTTPRKISVFGATGSIGVSTLNLIRERRSAFQVEVLTAHRNVDLLAEQVREFCPRLVVIGDDARFQDLKDRLDGFPVEIAAGREAVIAAAREPVDWFMSSIVGAAGLAPTLAAIQTGTTVALANKESLVCAGDIMLSNVQKYGATLLPVDSEHNAIFQVLDDTQMDKVERLILTASGGPFLDRSRADMANVTREQALAHPNWDMGAKISIDSATMMNKGLELIEAVHLFPVGGDQVDIIVHPQSVIHSMVEYRDGSVLAQMGTPDMRTPISYALGWPERHAFKSERLDFRTLGSLEFRDPDPVRFPALRLAREALEAGGSAPTILNAANEVAVAGFLAGDIGFLQIAEVVERTLQKTEIIEYSEIDDIYSQDRKGREAALQVIKTLS
ncbi:1-deoxy-D-xylulose-5-phosphate reductoisomerase [Sneathiella chinensis]|uniref:1-deoxy-D-xylulose 5-phosphate reductoisomerase n=1 Tax=Sneathiella chinensis TaxID=349750 RepID=A0ABQ5U4V7_9PROT|nr:1-deoxy-D-xylulose-5-phosphate reductoisomerase [Sneathiella chinensis]GLQ07202.1 1-deoxy-D-xylulose 5-phosphate reductoisomerase [Sneathiella chinensis]